MSHDFRLRFRSYAAAAAVMSIFLANCVLANRVLANDAAPAGSAEKGKIAFVKHGCWQCHGFEGQGSIATSNGAVLAPDPLPLETFTNFVRSSNRSMPPYRETILSNADLADIYAFLQSIPKTQNYKNILPLSHQE
jgi:mono/diheme cytochrome c family protein